MLEELGSRVAREALQCAERLDVCDSVPELLGPALKILRAVRAASVTAAVRPAHAGVREALVQAVEALCSKH
jgi:hypothetical protein